ncbi:MAG: ATP-binding cassette domain-containing protein [Bacteroidales bacterium]|jgi:putative ABC transport system ATP-binding protein|nr:ATP-binding cassette domain-containing protein [Bacteroidales bacterium]
MLSTRNIEFTYNVANSFRFPDITCKKGEHWLIMGPSGCGKTTLLHLMAGLLRPAKGYVQIGDTDITAMTPSQVDRLRGMEIGIVFQAPHFIQSLTVAENVLVARYLNRLDEDAEQVRNLLKQLNIGEKYASRPNELSQGESQRLSIARALINRPSVILADEPTSSLDDDNCAEVVALLEKQAENTAAALIVVTHDQRLTSVFRNVIKLK